MAGAPIFTLTRQSPATASRLVLDETTTPTSLAQAVTRDASLQDALVASIHDAAVGLVCLEPAGGEMHVHHADVGGVDRADRQAILVESDLALIDVDLEEPPE